MDQGAIDPVAVLEALGVAGVRSATPVTGGWDASIWRVEQEKGLFALRLFRVGKDEDCRREARVMRAAATGGLPVPAVCAEGAWRDRPALLLSWCAGRPLLHEVRARPWRAWRLAVAAGRMLARLHRVAPPELRRAEEAWTGWVGPLDAKLTARLRALAPEPGALIHLDYHPLNLLTDGREITAVLDWTNAAIGDPRADLARAIGILRLAPMAAGRTGERIGALLIGRLLEWGCVHGYCRAAGPVREMAPFHAWSWEVMARDLEPRLGRPGHWLRPEHLDTMRRRAASWRRRAGLAG
jgi:aminoglycoside phosphotransferase (APT) family kinase protein